MAALVSVASASWAGGDWPDAEPMSADQLEAASGRQGIPLQWQLNESEQNALVSGNVLSGPVEDGRQPYQ